MEIKEIQAKVLLASVKQPDLFSKRAEAALQQFKAQFLAMPGRPR